MDVSAAKKPLILAATLCVLAGGGWWGFKRLRPAGPAGAGPRAAPSAPADPADALLAAHHAAGTAKDWPRQEALWAEFAASGGAPALRRRIQDDRAGFLLRALEQNDEASADRLAAAMIAATGNDEIKPRHALKQWLSRQVEKWRAARAAKNDAAAAAALAALSSWEPLDSDAPRELIAVASAAELMPLAQNALAARAYASAAVLLRAIAMASGEQAVLRAMLDDAIMGLASDPGLNAPRPDAPPASVDLYLRVAGPRRVEALGLAAAAIEARADQLLAGKPELCGPLYDEAQRRLNEAASLERAPLAEAVAARLDGKAADARLAATLKPLDTAPEDAFVELRPLMREGKDEARAQRALEAVVAAWRKARDAKAFDRLLDLSGFLVAEAGAPEAEDPFRAEFKAGLVALAAEARTAAPDKRVLALALLADAFPADPEGRAARRDGAAAGAELARAAARAPAPKPLGNSGLSARSVLFVENATARHALLLFDGPETFFVRVSPHRRGSVVFKDGTYLVGVTSHKDESPPHALDAVFGSILMRQKFVAENLGPAGPGQGRFGIAAPGHWTLLRAPDGEKYGVNPMSGAVRP